MSPEETPEVEQPVPKKVTEAVKVEDAPLTKEGFVSQWHKIAERAQAAGFSPLRVLGETYAKRGMRIVANLLDALDDADQEPKRKRSRAKGK